MKIKKVKLVAAAIAVAVVASADVGINFASIGNTIMNPGFTYPPTGGGQVLDAGGLVQLVWRQDNTGYQGAHVTEALTSAAGGYEKILLTGSAGIAGNFSVGTGPNGFYADADVDGNDVNAGYFFLRIFAVGAPVVGTTFSEFGLTGNTLVEFDAGNTATIYQNWADGNQVGIDEQIASAGTGPMGISTQVIPEPATFGLMGVAGLGMYLARRKTRR